MRFPSSVDAHTSSYKSERKHVHFDLRFIPAHKLRFRKRVVCYASNSYERWRAYDRDLSKHEGMDAYMHVLFKIARVAM